MARFYAEIEGNRGLASRMGTAASGMFGHVRGWDIGARVDMQADGNDDVCRITATSGSNGCQRFELGTLRNVDGSMMFTPSEALRTAMGAPGIGTVEL